MFTSSGEPRSTCRRQNSRLWISLLLLPTTCLFARLAEAKCSSGTAVSAETSTYVFVAGQSKVVQTGGIAGVHWTYSVEGHFQLIVDPDAGTASFAHVDANATDDSPFKRTLDPNDVFNMTLLLGTVLDDTTISFAGKATDGSDVLITLTVQDDLAYLVGETIPPPNTADFFVFILDALAQRKYGGGTGEPNHPYLIYTAEQMNAIGAEPNDWGKHFKLMADIDLSGYAGDVFNVIGCYAGSHSPKNMPFTGIFDGNCHTISNFNYTPSGEGGYIGLFGHISGENAIIKNVRLADPNVGGLATSVGALVGSLEKGTVLSCYVAGGSVSGFGFAGGLVGGNSGGMIEDCHATDSTIHSGHNAGGLLGGNEDQGTVVDCSARDSISEGKSAGGLVGENHGGIGRCYSSGQVLGWFGGGLVAGNIGVISDCYSVSFVKGGSGTECYGGLVGFNHGIITKCYASGGVSGENVGGLVGHNEATVADSYWDVQSSGATTSAGGTPKTTADMKQRITFANWDFVGVWDMAKNQTYPYLRKYSAPDINQDGIVSLLDLCIMAEQWMQEQE